MKRVISILLCILMLVTTVTLFASCKKEYTGEPEISKKIMEVDITGYSITYDSDVSGTSQAAIIDFSKLVQSVTGVSVKVNKDSGANASAGGQIMIGNVDREAAQKALDGIDGFGWTIRVIDGDIVIAGTTQLLTNMAMEYFTENYLTVEEGTKTKNPVLSVHKKVLLEGVPMVALASGNQSNYTFVYSQLLDDIDGSAHVIEGSGHAQAGDTKDIPVILTTQLIAEMKKVATASNDKMVSDANTNYEKEVLVGTTDREEMYEVYNALAGNEYGVFVRGNKIAVAGHNDETLQLAVPVFRDTMIDSYAVDEDEVGGIFLPDGYSLSKKMETTWAVDFPKPVAENIYLAGSISTASDSLVYAYQGTGVTAKVFDDYCKTLRSSGYTLVQENTIDGNKFATYKNETANVLLYIQYAAHAYEVEWSFSLAEQYLKRYEPTIRISSSPLTSVTLPGADLLTKMENTSFERITDTMITQINAEGLGTKGMFYVITLEDGSFIVVDGATSTGLSSKLWTVLNNLYKKAHNGNSPSEGDPIHIRAWLLTHEHNDHYNVLNNFLQTYGKNNKVKFDYLLANFASAINNDNNTIAKVNNYVYNKLSELKGYCTTPFKYVKVHTGQVFYLANAKLDILFTHEDQSPARQPYGNDTSTIFKLTLFSYDENNGNFINEDENGDPVCESMMITGDSSMIAGTYMRSMFSEATLNVDHVQIAHHAGNGLEWEMYELMSPTTTWWPASTGKATGVTSTTKTIDGIANYYVMKTLPSHKYAFTEGAYSTTVKITKNGAQYNALFDALTGNAITGFDTSKGVIDVTAWRG